MAQATAPVLDSTHVDGGLIAAIVQSAIGGHNTK
jgi:hypothetical protein